MKQALESSENLNRLRLRRQARSVAGGNVGNLKIKLAQGLS